MNSLESTILQEKKKKKEYTKIRSLMVNHVTLIAQDLSERKAVASSTNRLLFCSDPRVRIVRDVRCE